MLKYTNFTKCAQPLISFVISDFFCFHVEHKLVLSLCVIIVVTACTLTHTHAHTSPSFVFLRIELYDPYNPASSDSEHEMPQGQDHNQDNNLGPQHLSPSKASGNKGRWDIPYSKTGSQPPHQHDFSLENRPTNSQALSLGHRLPERQAYSPNAESFVPLGYGSTSRPLDHRVGSSDRLTDGSLTQRFPASYGAQRMNGEDRIPIPEYRSEVSPVRLKEQQLLCVFSECKYLYSLGSVILFNLTWRLKQNTGPVCSFLGCGESVTISSVRTLITM